MARRSGVLNISTIWRIAVRMSLGLSVTFLAFLTVLHVLEREFNSGHLGHWKSHCVDGCVNCLFAESCLVSRGKIIKLHDARAPLEYLRDVANRKQTANCLIHCSPPPAERQRERS